MAARPRATGPARKKDAAQLWDYALNALGRRALSTGEMRRRLREKAADLGDVEPAIAKLKEYGYLDDARFAETFAASRLNNQGLGKIRVVRDLRGRRVAGTVAEQAVERTYEATNEAELVEQFLARKFRNTNLAEYLQDPNHLASAYRKLRYAGFGAGISIRALKRYTERAAEIEEE